MNERRPLYAEADLTVVINDETPEAVADGILQLVPSLLKDPTQRRTDQGQILEDDGNSRRAGCRRVPLKQVGVDGRVARRF